MNKKPKKIKIKKEELQKILNQMPPAAKQKMMEAHKAGKKVNIKLKLKKKGVESPYNKKDNG